jgi:hypothetical protein
MSAHPRAISRSDVLMLQQTIGNRAVQQLLSGSAQRQSREAAPPRRGDASNEVIRRSAQVGVQTRSSALPFAGQIQRAFGRHDVSRIQAHVGEEAAASAVAMNASAYATGEHVVFAGKPTLHTAAHEAAHVVQQRGGVQLAGGVGRVRDSYEQHADAVAARVAAGQSAEDLLGGLAGGQEKTARSQVAGSNVAMRQGENVQRAVGFEFQCRYWKIMDYTDLARPELYDPGKGAAPFLKAADNGWKLISDGGEPEFVVTHVPETDKVALTSRMKSLTTVAKAFNKNVNKKFAVRTTLGGTHNQDEKLWIEPKAAKAKLNADPQVTAGFRFERLLDLFMEQSQNKDATDILMSNVVAKNYAKDPKIVETSTLETETIITAYQHGRNWAALQYLKNNVLSAALPHATIKLRIQSLLDGMPNSILPNSDLEFTDNALEGLPLDLHGEMSNYINLGFRDADITLPVARQAKYAGFVALLGSYLRKAGTRKMTYIKDFPFLAKSNLAEAARYAVPPNFDYKILLADALAAGGRENEDEKIYKDEKEEGAPTIKEWIMGLKTGKDLLSHKDNPDYADPSMGTLRTEQVGADSARAIILELRRVKNDMDYDQWEKWAESVRAWLERLNAAASGTYAPYEKPA